MRESQLPDIKVPVNVQLMLAVLVVVIIVFGVYPQPMLNLTNDTVTKIIAQLK